MFAFEYRVALVLALAGLAFGGCSAAASGADVGAGDARSGTDTGSATNDVGAADPDVGAGNHDAGETDASADIGIVHDGGSTSDAGSCALLDTCCPRITGNPEFHDGCVIAVASGNAASCSASLAQDCCAALQNCCGAIADSNQRMLCQEVVSSHDGTICQSDLASACSP